MVLAFATALGEGITRDLLIGALPPASLRDWRYAALAFLGGFIVFFLHRYVNGIPIVFVLVLDAATLSLFAVAGTEKALLYKMPAVIATLLGTITAVGGGVLRDIFLARVPRLLTFTLPPRSQAPPFLAVFVFCCRCSACGSIGICPGCEPKNWCA